MMNINVFNQVDCSFSKPSLWLLIRQKPFPNSSSDFSAN